MRLQLLTALTFVSLLSGCPATTSQGDGGNGGGGGQTGTGGGSSVGGGGGTGVTADGGTAYAPTLTSAQGHVTGRTGKDLTVTVSGKDRNLDVQAARVRVLDAQGNPVVAIDSNRDGTADTAEALITLDGKKWVGEAITGTALLRGVFGRTAAVTQVAVKLSDATSLESDEQVATITTQGVMQLGEGCDTSFIENRCAPSLGCRGTPPVCAEGLAPQITRLAFYKSDAGGPTIMVEGTEPEDDLAIIRITFQGADGGAVSIDTDGDAVPDLASFDQDALGKAVDGTFFMSWPGAEGLEQQVSKLVAQPIDAADHLGTAKSAAATFIPVRSAGQSCDPRGFDVCAAGLTCSPGTIGSTANKCASANPLRTQQCTAAPVLVATTSGAKLTGLAEGGSLWDAPNGCSSNNPVGRPEGLVKVRLNDRTNKLTLSTLNAGTNFDTTLYVLPTCAADSSTALGCSDDAMSGTSASTLVLEDMPAGDYFVVIDSFDQLGGTYELTATVE